MSLMDPGNVERPAVNNQGEGWPVERCGQWGMVLTQVRWRPLVVDQVRRLATPVVSQ
jgi:hypothetical protein